MYLLDANVLITAHNNYYAIDQVPEYWGWLVDQAARSFIKMPIEIIEEVKAGRKKEVKNDKIQKDLLYDWIEKHAQKILLDEQVDSSLVRRVVAEGYANDLTDEQVDSLGRDPFLHCICAGRPRAAVCCYDGSLQTFKNSSQSKNPGRLQELSRSVRKPVLCKPETGLSHGLAADLVGIFSTPLTGPLI